MTAGVIGVTAGVAGATSAAGFTASTATTVASTGTAQAGANMNVTLIGSKPRATKTVDLTVKAARGTVTFNTLTATGTGVTVNSTTKTVAHPNVWILTITTSTLVVTQSIALTAVKYTTTGVLGTVVVTLSGTATATLTGKNVVDAKVPTTTNLIKATAPPTVQRTATTQLGADIHVEFTGSVDAKKLHLTASVKTGTVLFAKAPTVSSVGFSTATVSLTSANHHIVNVALVQTATHHSAEEVTFATVQFNTTGATPSITVTASATAAATASVTFFPSSVTDATISTTVTTKNEIAATAATKVLRTAAAQPGADIHVTFTHTLTPTTLTLTVAAASGTAVFASAPTVTHKGFATATATLTANKHVVKVALVVTPATHAAEQVTFTAVTLTTTSAGGNITVTASGKATATTVKFTPASVTDATATVAPVSGGIVATSAPTVPATGTNNAAGDLVVTLRGNTATKTATTSVHLHVAPANATGTVHWREATLSTTTVTAAEIAPNGTSSTLDVIVAPLAVGKVGTLHLTGITYNTKTAEGTIKVTPVWVNGLVTVGSFSPAFAVNAKSTVIAPATHPSTHTITATSTPGVGLGAVGAAVGNWTVTLGGNTSEGWTKTRTVTIIVGPDNGVGRNCTHASYVLLTGTPTVTVGTATGVSTTPTVAAAAGVVTPCSGTSHNDVVISFTNSGTFTSAHGSFKLFVSGVKYDVGSTTTLGNVSVQGAFTTTTVFQPTSHAGAATHGPSNADVSQVYVTANTPAVSVTQNAFDAGPISPINVNESVAGKVTVGYVCISLNLTSTFNPNAPTAKAAVKGTATVTSKVTYESATGTAVTSGSATYARFEVTKVSSVASIFSVSGLKVNTLAKTGTVTATVKDVASTTSCKAAGTAIGSAVAFSIKPAGPQLIYGATADATAVHQLETRFPATGATGSCVGGHKNATNNRPVILATTKTYQDTLSSAYLAGYLNTGTLLTPTTKLSTVTLQALKTEGVTEVYVMGGPLAITTTVVTQLETTPAYNCGGTGTLQSLTGATQFIHVTRIGGETQYDTSMLIASSVPRTRIGAMSFTGAYAGVNATKGNGMYNDTAGTGSTVPLTAARVPTAILANGAKEYQDAMAASALAYGTSIPILLTTTTKLTTQAVTAIETLGIKQVIVMGGELAITNTQVTALEKLGVSVLRIAGINFTDTAAELAKFEENTVTVLGRGWSGIPATRPTSTSGKLHKFAVARGNGFTDGMAGADITGYTHIPQLLTESPTTVGTYLTAFLKAAGLGGKGVNTNGTSKLSTFDVFGGPLAVSPAVISKIQGDIG